MTSRCSARPDDLLAGANEMEHLTAALRREVASFDGAIELFVFRTHGFFAAIHWSDPLWSVINELDDIGSSLASIAAAFEAAGGGGPSVGNRVVTSDAAVVDGWLRNPSWKPDGRRFAGDPGAWARAVFGACCASWGDAGYQGRGFLTGPDGRSYPLVAPHVVRDGATYHADDGLAPGRPSVLDLDGRDPGWTTVYEQIGVERSRPAPSVAGRVLAGLGATAVGPPTGSTETDVDSVVITPGRAPALRRRVSPGAAPAPSPPLYTPSAPPVPPPNVPDLEYPVGQTSVSAGAMGLAPVVLDGLVGAVDADLGSHDAYDVVLQQNTDGRLRALYRRVFVGFDQQGEPELSSVYVTGPERNDQVSITYAPPG